MTSTYPAYISHVNQISNKYRYNHKFLSSDRHKFKTLEADTASTVVEEVEEQVFHSQESALQLVLLALS